MLRNNSYVIFHVRLLPDHAITISYLCPAETFQDAVHTRTQCTTPESICGRSVRESWTKGSSGVRPVIYWAGLMGCEGVKAEDYTRVRIGLSLAWKAS